MSQNESNLNLNDMISQLLSDPQKMQQLQQMASSLGLGGNSAQSQSNSSSEPSPALSPMSNPSSPDLNQLLQNFASQMQPQNRTTSEPSFDLSGLLGSLGTNQTPQNSPPAFDFSSMQKIQQAMQLFSQSNPNVDFLRAMRPLLSQKRAKKVDDAIRIMQLIQVLPLIKESGLFGFGGEQR